MTDHDNTRCSRCGKRHDRGSSCPVAKLERELLRAQHASEKAALARATLPAGSSRARVTSANAKWMRAAEHRDLVIKRLDEAKSLPPTDRASSPRGSRSAAAVLGGAG